MVLYLPPYSPDFNPIEMIWSKVKRLLRSIAARTVDALHQAFGTAFAAHHPSDVLGCFRHCGYATIEGAPALVIQKVGQHNERTNHSRRIIPAMAIPQPRFSPPDFET